MLFASQRVAKFRDRKTKGSNMLINHLKVILLLVRLNLILFSFPSLPQRFLELLRSFDISIHVI